MGLVGGTIPQAGDLDGLKGGRRSKLETVGIFSPLPPSLLLGYHDPSLPCHNGQSL